MGFLQQALMSSYKNNCPSGPSGAAKVVPWWGDRLQGLRSRARKCCNMINRTKSPAYWDLCRRAQREYTEAIIAWKSESWKSFCAGIASALEAIKLHEILARNPGARLDLIQLSSGEYTSSKKESLNHLMEANFSGFRRVKHHEDSCPRAPPHHVPGQDWRLASWIVRADRVRWSIE